MKLSFSNIALQSFDHIKELSTLHAIGFEGIEVAPSKVWEDVINVSYYEIQSYRRKVEKSGLSIIGLHSLFWDQPQLGLFKDSATRGKTFNFLVHLSKVCRDLGGSFLVFGSPQARRRNDISIDNADLETVAFFSELAVAIENHNTSFVIEALGKNETDYIDSLKHALSITNKVNRKELMSHVDAKAVFDANEAKSDIFDKVKSTLKHCHANDPGLGILGETGKVDHALFSNLLKEIGYQGYVTAEQRMVNPDDLITPLKRSYMLMEKFYL